MRYEWTQAATGETVATGPVALYPFIDGGAEVLILTVTDMAGQSHSDRIEIASGSVAPQADAGDARTVRVGEAVRLDASGSVDPSGTPLSFAWSVAEAPEGSTAVISDPTALRPSFTPDLDGVYRIELIASNADGRISNAASVLLSTDNSAPRAVAGPDLTTQPGGTVLLDPAGTVDADADALETVWTLLSAPTGSSAELVTQESGRIALTPDLAGAYVVQLSVTDGMGTDRDQLVVFAGMDANVPPVAQAGPDIALIGNGAITLDGSGSTDADGDRLSYAWTLAYAPAGATPALEDADTAAARLIPDGAGPYVVQLSVRDAAGGVSRDTVLIASDGLQSRVDAGFEAAIADDATTVAGRSTQTSATENAFAWAELGLAAAPAVIATPDSLSTSVTFDVATAGPVDDPRARAGLDVLRRYAVFTSYDHYAQGRVYGRAAIGGWSKGGSSFYGQGLGDTSGTDVLIAQKGFYGGYRKAWGGGNIRTGGKVRARLATHRPGRVLHDRSVELWDETAGVRALSAALDALTPTSDWAWADRRAGIIRLPAVPDASGVAVLTFDTANSLIDNRAVRKIALEAGDARTIVINLRGQRPDLRRAHLIGDFLDKHTAARVIWNFPEARQLKIRRTLRGSVLAPHAKTYIWSPVQGSVAVGALHQKADIHLPVFKGEGLDGGQAGAPARFALLQLAVEAGNGLAPDADSTFATIGNLRPRAVIASATANGAVVAPGTPVVLDSAASMDDDTTGLTRIWSVLAAPDGAALPDGEARTATTFAFTPERPGDYVVQLIVSDGALDAAPTTYRVRLENEPPIADAGADLTVLRNAAATLDGTASSDPEGAALRYLWSVASAPDDADPVLDNAAQAVARLSANVPGTYVLSLVVSDGQRDSTPDTVTVTVENRAPVAVATGPETGFAGDTIMVSGVQSTDADGDTLAYRWSVAGPDGSTARFADPFRADPSFVPDLAGPYTLSLTVFDGFDDSETVTLTLDISDANRPPVLETVGDRTFALGEQVSVQLSATDPDGDPLSFTAGPLPLPQGATFDANSGLFTYRPRMEGALNVSFGVSDGSLRDSDAAVFTATAEDNGGLTSYTGRIVDARTGEPIADTLVMVGEIAGRTGTDGVFRLDGLEPGPLSVWIVADDATATDADGARYAATQVGDVLIENVLNRAVPDIRLTTLTASAPVVSDAPITVSGGPFSLTLEIPAGGLEGADELVGFTALSPDQANALPRDIVPCQLFSLEPKTVRTILPTTVSVDNFDNLPEGAVVDLWAFDGTVFAIIGSGRVESDRITATVPALRGGQPLAFAPRRGVVEIAQDQPGGFYLPGTLNEGALKTGFSLPTYNSVGEDRGLAFTYTSTSAAPAPIVSAVTTLPANSGVPARISQSVRIGDSVVSLDASTEISEGVENTTRIAQSGLFDASSFETGVYPAEFLSVSEYACSRVGATASTDVVVRNESESPFGAGWTIPELTRLDIDDMGRVSIIDGQGRVSTFTPREELGSVRETFAVDVGGDQAPVVLDIDDNGTLDIVAADTIRGTLRFFINQGDANLVENTDLELLVGTPTPTDPRPAGGASDLGSLRAGDFNGDGIAELVTSSDDRGEILIVSRVDGRYDISQEIDVTGDVVEIQIADFNGDGFEDIVSYGNSGFSRRLRFYLNDGTGTFAFAEQQTRSGIDVQVGDMDGDGRPDIVVLDGNNARIRYNVGNLDFEEVVVRLPASANRFNGDLVQIGDVDQDGDLDFVVSTLPDVTYVENTGNRTWATLALPRPAGFGNADNVTLADVSGDGLLDVIVDERTPQPRYALFEKLADAGFADARAVVFGHPIGETRVVDIDADGLQDLVSKARFQLYVDFGQNPDNGNFNSPFGDFSSLVRNEDGTFTRRYTNGSTVTYGANGLQLATSDRNGNVSDYAYDAQGRLVSITDPTGQVTVLAYGSDGLLDSVTDPTGRSSQFTHDGAGTLIEVRDPEDQPRRYDYDEQQRLTTETNRRDLATVHSYGAGGRYTGSAFDNGESIGLSVARTLGLPDLGGEPGEFVPEEDRVTEFVDGRGNMSSVEVNAFGSIIRRVDALGRETLYERNRADLITAVTTPSSVTESGTVRTEMRYDVRGNLLELREAVGTDVERVSTYEYEPVFSRPVRITDADGFVRTYEYDAAGNRTRIVEADGTVQLFTYDPRGRVLTQTDRNGNVTTFEYDSFSRLLAVIDANNVRQEMVRDEAGNIIAQIDDISGPAERRTESSYDDLNRKVGQTAADGGVTQWVYDGNDNVVSITGPTGVTETRRYDERDRLVEVANPAMGTKTYAFDADSNISEMTDGAGEVTTLTYDAVNNLLSSTDALGQVRAFAYDSRDNVTAVTDARGNLTQFDYDALDRRIARANPVGDSWRYAFDGRDNRISAIKPDGTAIAYVYDELSRPTAVSGGDIERSFGYDDQGNLVSATHSYDGVAGAAVAFEWDVENRIASDTVSNLFGQGEVNNRFDFAYDRLDRRISMTDSFDGTTTRSFDGVDRTTRVENPLGEAFAMTYDLAGRMLERQSANATVETRSYQSETGRLATLSHSSIGGVFNAYAYDYTDRGDLGSIVETGTVARTRDYSYDAIRQLTDVAVPDMPTDAERYTLDPEGNRNASHLSAAYETDAANRLQSDDSYRYAYDVNGNLVSRTAQPGTGLSDWAYAYDTLDQLVEVSRDGVVVERYRYDGAGRRASIDTLGDDGGFVRTALVQNGAERKLDLRQDAATGETRLYRRYTHGEGVDRPLGFEAFAADGTLEQSYTYHADHQGSIRFVTDSLGEVVNSYEYDSFGRFGVVFETVEQPYAYTGREWDAAAELYHYRARAYDPQTGRFLQEDPAKFAAGDLNVYRYVMSNPVNYNDPSGLIAALTSTGAYQQAVGLAPPIANVGWGLGCLFAKIAASIEFQSDLVSNGGASGCAATVVNNHLDLVTGKLPLGKQAVVETLTGQRELGDFDGIVDDLVNELLSNLNEDFIGFESVSISVSDVTGDNPVITFTVAAVKVVSVECGSLCGK